MPNNHQNNSKIDTAALLARVDIVEVIGRYVPLTKAGAEYEACCPFHTESTPSFKANQVKQFYHCFGCAAHGNAIDFLVAQQGLSFLDACHELGGNMTDAGAQSAPNVVPARPKKKKSAWVALHRSINEPPAPPVAHIKRGRPSHTWCYRNPDGMVLGYVYRYSTSDGGKETLPITWAVNEDTGAAEWRWMAFAEPRPLYLGDSLRPDRPVLVTEGEKCTDAAHKLIGDVFDVVSWPGGCKAVHKADWSWLAGRNVLIWPDCDAQRDKNSQELYPEAEQAGVKAANAIAKLLARLDCKVRLVKIPAPGEKPSGWDVADAIEEGWTHEQMLEFLRANQYAPASDVAATLGAAATSTMDSDVASAGAEKSWTERLVYKRGELAICTANIADILLNRPEWKGVLGYDDFEKKVVKLKPPPFYGGEIGAWSDDDDTWTSMWLARTCGFTPSSVMVAEAVVAIAKKVFRFNPVRDWLASLKWDGIPRLDDWLTNFLGVEKTDYSMRVGRYFMIAMIDRAMNPGGQFKYCMILEGPQDAGKSKTLRILGGHWYGDNDLDLHNKDSMVGIQGKWLYEFAELDSLSRAESSRTKSFLSRQVDEFRPHYGRGYIKCPRQTVFVGTVNEYEYIKDPTGAVRFWPVLCQGDLNHDGLVAMREQLFAEAMQRHLDGERFWPTYEEQRDYFGPQQFKREQQDSLVDALHDWVYGRLTEFSKADAIIAGLKLDASKISRDMDTRVGIALRRLGCTRVERRNGMIRYWYKPPQKSAGSMAVMPAQQEKGSDHVPV